STTQPGHFGNGRARTGIVSDVANSLAFGTNSFTVETWMKTTPVVNAYTLVGKEQEGGYYYNTDFALRLLPSGSVRAYVVDTNKTQWMAEMPGHVYDPATRTWQVTFNDNQW